MEKAAGKGDMFGFEDDPGEDLAKLKRAWVNERNAPEILPYLEELMEDMKEQVRNQQHRQRLALTSAAAARPGWW